MKGSKLFSYYNLYDQHNMDKQKEMLDSRIKNVKRTIDNQPPKGRINCIRQPLSEFNRLLAV